MAAAGAAANAAHAPAGLCARGPSPGGFIGAGGYGRPILRGIDKFDVPLMLEGAIPAAVLALAIEAMFGMIERRPFLRR